MARIALTQNRVAIIDDEDLDKVSSRKWFYANGYAQNSTYTGGGRKNRTTKTVQLHRYILDEPEGIVDHKNHNTLDCRKDNLRLANHSENARNRRIPVSNSTGFKGVNRSGNKFRAQIYINGKNKHLGLFTDVRLAAQAYNIAAENNFGEFAHLNEV